MKKKKLGEILVQADLLTEEQLQKALSEHKKSGLRLGQYLVRDGVVAEAQIVGLLCDQLKIRKYRPDKDAVDPRLADLIPAEIAYQHQAVPLHNGNFLLTVAMIDPLSISAMDAIERHTKTEVEAVICTEREFNQLFNTLYGAYGGIGGVLEGIQIDEGEYKAEATEEIEMDSLQDMAQKAPVIALVNSIISQAIRENVSDVHISPQKKYVRVRFRVDGKKVEAMIARPTIVLLRKGEAFL